MSASLKVWAPKLHAYYITYMNKLWANDTANRRMNGEAKKKPKLHCNFACSMYPSMALNFGPNV